MWPCQEIKHWRGAFFVITLKLQNFLLRHILLPPSLIRLQIIGNAFPVFSYFNVNNLIIFGSCTSLLYWFYCLSLLLFDVFLLKFLIYSNLIGCLDVTYSKRWDINAWLICYEQISGNPAIHSAYPAIHRGDSLLEQWMESMQHWWFQAVRVLKTFFFPKHM